MDIGRNHVYPPDVADSINRQARLERLYKEELDTEDCQDHGCTEHNPYGRVGTRRSSHYTPPLIAKDSYKKRKARKKAQRQARAKSRR